MNLKEYIRDIPDFPKKGILFHDVTTLFKHPQAFEFVMKSMHDWYKDLKIDYVLGIEARGFIVGGILANSLSCGFVPIRKPGKLPADVIMEEYELEYGTDKVEIHKDALKKGDRVIVVDDLVATGGTLLAGIRLAEKLQANIIGVASVIDMPDLGGREKLSSYNYQYLVEYSGH
jgi:adenine phosphoribosyltransferase